MRGANHFTVKPSGRMGRETVFDVLCVHWGQLTSHSHNSALVQMAKLVNTQQFSPSLLIKLSEMTQPAGVCVRALTLSLSLPAFGMRGIMEMRMSIVIDWGALSFFSTRSILQFSSGFINACTDDLSLCAKKHLTKLFSSAVN